MKTRRGFFGMLLSGALVARFVPGAWARPVGSGGFHMVNGWILTDRDVEDLRKYQA